MCNAISIYGRSQSWYRLLQIASGAPTAVSMTPEHN